MVCPPPLTGPVDTGSDSPNYKEGAIKIFMFASDLGNNSLRDLRAWTERDRLFCHCAEVGVGIAVSLRAGDITVGEWKPAVEHTILAGTRSAGACFPV